MTSVALGEVENCSLGRPVVSTRENRACILIVLNAIVHELQTDGRLLVPEQKLVAARDLDPEEVNLPEIRDS